MNALKVRKKLEANGWVLVRIKGSHHHFKHPVVKKMVTLPCHSSKDLSKNIINSIVRMSGVLLK